MALASYVNLFTGTCIGTEVFTWISFMHLKLDFHELLLEILAMCVLQEFLVVKGWRGACVTV